MCTVARTILSKLTPLSTTVSSQKEVGSFWPPTTTRKSLPEIFLLLIAAAALQILNAMSVDIDNLIRFRMNDKVM